jgi:hypothetical protein
MHFQSTPPLSTKRIRREALLLYTYTQEVVAEGILLCLVIRLMLTELFVIDSEVLQGSPHLSPPFECQNLVVKNEDSDLCGPEKVSFLEIAAFQSSNLLVGLSWVFLLFRPGPPPASWPGAVDGAYSRAHARGNIELNSAS